MTIVGLLPWGSTPHEWNKTSVGNQNILF